MEERIILYYVGTRLDSKSKRSYVYTDRAVSTYWAFTKKLVDIPVGMSVEVTPTETGVKGPYKPLWLELKHPNANEWHVQDVAEREIIRAKQVQSKVPEKVAQFEELLGDITEGMNRTQRQISGIFI